MKSSWAIAAAGGDDDAAVDEPVDHFDGRNQQPARVAADVDHQALHAVAVKLPQGGVEVAGGGLLEASELEIADPVLRIDDCHLIDAGHFDHAAADAHLARRLAGGGQGQVDDAAVGALQQVGGLVGGESCGRLAVDGQDPVAGADAGLFGGTAGNHAGRSSARRPGPSIPRPGRRSSLRSGRRLR